VLIGAAALAIGASGHSGDGHSGDGRTALIVALAGLLLLAAIAWERRSALPLFPHGMFRPGTVLGGGVMFVFFISFGTSVTAIYAPYFLSALHGVPPLAEPPRSFGTVRRTARYRIRQNGSMARNP
jgi:hypothetical protein